MKLGDLEEIIEGTSWIKIPAFVANHNLTANQAYDALMSHHEEETRFLIEKVREMAEKVIALAITAGYFEEDEI